MTKRQLSYISFGFFLLVVLGASMGIFLLPKGKAFYNVAASQAFLKEGKPEKAVERAQRAVELQPSSLLAARTLTQAYAAVGKYDEAERTINDFIAASPDRAEAYYDLAALRFRRHDKEGTREAVERSITLDPNLADNYHLLAAMALEDKDLPKAEEYLGRAAGLAPDNPMTHYLLGLVHHEKGEISDAIEELRKVTATMPNYASAHSLLAMCYLEQKLYIHALSELKIAADLDPSDYNSMYNIACVYSLQDKPAPALKWLERALNNGFNDFDHMSQDHDLDNIRNLPEYAKLIETHSQEAASPTMESEPTTQPETE